MGIGIIMENRSKEIIKTRNKGVFDEFYLFYLQKAEKQLAYILNRAYNFYFDKEKMMSEAMNFLKDSLIEKGTKALIAELKIFKEKSGKNCTYKEFINYISEEKFHIYFDDKYIVLKELLERKVETFIELYSECLMRLSNDKEDIENVIGTKIDFVEKISFSIDGDTHNGGKSVIQLDINDGRSLFYKPHTLAMDVIFDAIISILQKQLDNFEYEHIKTLDKKEYGWQEKIEYCESASIDDVKNYYYSVGVTLAMFYVLGTEDIHAGNLISKGNMPAYVDLEVLLANKNKEYIGAYRKNQYWDLKKIFVDSVLGTYILPNNTPTSLIDIDICALTSGQSIGKESEKLYYFGITNNGTINIHFEKKKSEAYESLSNVRYKETLVEADAYIKEIADGFRDAYVVIKNEKKAILAILDKHSDDRIRQVIRTTYVYGKYLDAAYHPNYLKSAAERKRVISLIYGKLKKNTKMLQIADKEIEMLYRDDIPYFYTKYDSCNLFCYCDGKETVVEKAYANSLKDSLEKRISNLSKQDMCHQVDLIYASFANFGKYRINKMSEQDKKIPQLVRQKRGMNIPEKYVKTIFEIMLDKCIEVDDICSMISFEPDINDKYRISYLSGNLYNGLGVVFFMTMADMRFNCKNTDIILKLIKGIETIYPYNSFSENIASSFNGLTGRLYIYEHIYDQIGCVQCKKYYDEIVEYLGDKELLQDDKIDYVTGVCGGIVALINLYSKNKDVRLPKIIKRYAKFIKGKIDCFNYENVLNGMAHGFSGFIMALFKIYEFEGEKYYYDKAIELVKIENTSYSEKEKNWKDKRNGKYDMVFWCHGAAGIGLTRAATIKYIEHDKKLKKIWIHDIKSSMEIVKKEGIGVELKHGICHGLMGNLMILDYMAEVINDLEMKALVREKLNAFLKRLERKPINYENPLNVEDVSFMLGLSGIGYSIMKLIYKDIPNILLFEV